MAGEVKIHAFSKLLILLGYGLEIVELWHLATFSRNFRLESLVYQK